MIAPWALLLLFYFLRRLGKQGETDRPDRRRGHRRRRRPALRGPQRLGGAPPSGLDSQEWMIAGLLVVALAGFVALLSAVTRRTRSARRRRVRAGRDDATRLAPAGDCALATRRRSSGNRAVENAGGRRCSPCTMPPEGALIKREGTGTVTPAAVWIDLLNPTRDEDLLVEQALSHLGADARGDVRDRGLEPPLSGGRRALHDGRRPASAGRPLFEPPIAHARSPSSWPATSLVTVRYAEPRAFPIFISRAQKKDAALHDGHGRHGRPARGHHRPRGRPRGAHPGRGRQAVARPSSPAKAANRSTTHAASTSTIQTIGREGELTSRSRESLLTLDRLHDLSRARHGQSGAMRSCSGRRVKTASRDVQIAGRPHRLSVDQDPRSCSMRRSGMINNEQNTIIKIFSVLAVALMPPTLVGTDLRHELQAHTGARMAVGLSVRAGADGGIGACCRGSTSSARAGCDHCRARWSLPPRRAVGR